MICGLRFCKRQYSALIRRESPQLCPLSGPRYHSQHNTVKIDHNRVSMNTDKSWKVWRKALRTPQLYIYQPLQRPKEIRVMRLLSPRGGKLKCRIEHMDLGSAEYTALSYEWGPPAQQFEISVLDATNETIGKIRLTQNLHSALCSLQDSASITAKIFWIDQICINQSDIKERGHQVNLMRQIYKNASQVISYLGPAEKSDSQGFKLLERVHRQCSHLYHSPAFNEDLEETRNTFFNSNQVPQSLRFNITASDPAWKSLAGIIIGAWTRRLWMVQETCTFEKGDVQMLRGERVFLWTIAVAIIKLAHVYLLPLIWDDRITIGAIWMWDLRSNRASEISQLPVLLTMVSAEMDCKDNRDRVFALLGLSSDAEELEIKADYSKTYPEVLLDVAVRLIAKRGLAPLSFCSARSLHDGLPIPSWVPRWLRLEIAPIGTFTASGDLDAAATFSPDSSVMRSPGIFLAKIARNTGKFLDYLSGEMTFEELAQLEDVVDNARRYLARHPRSDIIISLTIAASYEWQTANKDTLEKGAQSLRATMRLTAYAKTSLQRSGTGRRTSLLSMENHISESDRTLAKSFIYNSTTYGRAICFTDSGQICLAPGHTQAGDVIVWLQGGTSVYILRPHGRNYLHVGEAYMHGVMEGEIIREPGWQDKVQTFSIV